MTKDKISDIKLEIESVEVLNDHSIVVSIHQTHMGDMLIDIQYPLLYQLEDDEWKDCGYYFTSVITDKYIVKYMPGEERVDEFIEYLDYAYDRLDKFFDIKPDEAFELKLFNDKELLRQRTVPSIGWLFVGWAEPNESLKIYTGEHGSFAGVMQHELVHHITLKQCNNNVPAWLAEGVAMLYGDMDYKYMTSHEGPKYKVADVSHDIEYLETLDLYNAQRETVWNWYLTSYLYVCYIEETYGKDIVTALFDEAGKKAFNSSVFNIDFDEDNRQTMTEILDEVMFMSKEELSKEYLEWLQE